MVPWRALGIAGHQIEPQQGEEIPEKEKDFTKDAYFAYFNFFTYFILLYLTFLMLTL